MEITPFIEKNGLLFNSIAFIVKVFTKVFRLFSRKNSNNSNIVVVLSIHKLGDSVFTIPAIRKLLIDYNKNLNLICYKDTADIYLLAFNKINLITVERKDFYFEGRIAKKRIRSVLKSLNPSLIVDITGSILSASILFNSSANKIVGLNKEIFKNIYDVYVSGRTIPHLTDLYMDVIKPITKFSSKKLSENKYEEYENKYILLHPFAGWKAKEWGLYRFIQLFEFLNNIFDTRLVIPSFSLKKDISNELKKKDLKYFETKTTKELIDVTKYCSLFIGNDSGPLHIASLLGKPTFTIYGPSNPEFHLPIDGINGFIFNSLKCSPIKNEKLCFTNGGRRGCPAYQCMYNLNFEMVKNEILDFIKTNKIIKNF